MANLDEMAYGGLADSYAKKYGIPTYVFRTAINQRTGFDPLYKSDKGEGIAGIDNKSKNPAINPFDINQSFDFAAQEISQSFKSLGNWEKAIKAFDPDGFALDEVQYDALGNVTSNSAETPKTDSQGIIPSADSYLEKAKNWLVSNFFNLLFPLFGLVLIIATAWFVVQKGSTGK